MGSGISLIVPYRDDDGSRAPQWAWLKRYWEHAFPEAELVMGTDTHRVFSKSVAINDAITRAKGDVLITLDSDAYMSAEVLRSCAETARRERTWFVPYSMLFRLTRDMTARLMASSPEAPARLYGPEGLPRWAWEDVATNEYGAMVQVFSREAFDLVGGWDERFRGWGGEDHAFLRSLDTLYAPHRDTKAFLYHLWHPRIGSGWAQMWRGQTDLRPNFVLIRRYRAATGHPTMMRRLVDEKGQ